MAKQNNSEYNVGVGVNLDEESVKKTTSVFSRLANSFTNFVGKISNIWKTVAGTSQQGEISQDNIVSSYLKEQINEIQNSIGNLNKAEEEAISGVTKIEPNKLNQYLLDTNKQIKLQQKELKGLEGVLDTYNKSTSKTTDENKNLADSFNLVSYASLGLFRKIFKFGINTFKGLAQAGSEYYEVNNNFNRIMKEGIGIASNYANKVAVAFGRNITDVKSDMTLIYTLLRNSNVEQRTAIALSANLVGIASDMASLWGVDTTQAVNAVIAGLQGLPKAAKSLGVYLTDSQIKEYLVQAGYSVNELSGSLTQNQRILGAYLKVMSDAGYAIGNFADNQNSVSNQLKILKSTIKSIKENLGTTLNTILSPLLKFLNGILKIINALANQLQYLPKSLQMIVGALALMITVLPILSAGFVIASYYGGKFKKHLANITSEMIEATGMTKIYGKSLMFLTKHWKSIAITTAALIIFISSLARMFKKEEKAENGAGDAAGDLTNKYKEMQKTLGGFDDVNIASFAKNDDGLDLIDTAAFSIENLEKSINEMVERMTGISDITDKLGGLNNILIAISGTILLIKGFKVLKFLTDVIGSSKIFITLYLKIQSVLKAISVFLKANIATIGTWAGSIASALAIILFSIQQLIGVFNSSVPVWLKVASVIFTVVAALGAIIVAINMIKHNWVGVAKGMLVAGIGATGVTGINYYGKTLKNNTPQMATGGVVSKPVVATVGEGKYDEAVVPLGNSPQFANMKSDIAEAVVAGLTGAKIGNNPINIEIKVDEDYIYRAYNRQSRLYGGR